MIRFECSCLLRVSVRFPNVGAKIHKIIETAKSPRRKKHKKNSGTSFGLLSGANQALLDDVFTDGHNLNFSL